jgi:hypothetical protein
MRAPDEQVDLTPESFEGPDVVIGTERALGNGVVDGIQDMVYVRRDRFEARHTRDIAREVARLNRGLVDAGRPYLLVGFGRWGSSDPWLGVPVEWGEVSGARVIVEATLPSMDVEPSQGSHFFHNLSSTGVLYFMVRHNAEPGIDWARLESAEPLEVETEWVRHVRLERPLRVAVDGRTGRGVVRGLED